MTSSSTEVLCLTFTSTSKKIWMPWACRRRKVFFGNAQLATATASALIGMIEKFGKKVTVTEMIGAGIRSEKLMLIGAVSASYYAGAVIGSIAVATGRSLAGGTSLSDVLLNAQMNHLHRPWLPAIMVRHPEIYKKRRVLHAGR